MALDPNILVTLLNPLEADDFMSRERDPANRRHVAILHAWPASGTSIGPCALNVRPKTYCSPGSTMTNVNN